MAIHYLLQQRHRQPLIDALKKCYAAWRDRAAQETDRSASSWVYSNFHQVFEHPIRYLETAETVYRDRIGLLAPTGILPYVLLPDNWYREIPDLLMRWHPNWPECAKLIECIKASAQVYFPELHTFRDPRGFEYQVIGWDRADATKRIEAQKWLDKPLTWCSSQGAWLDSGVACLGYRGFISPTEAADVEVASQAVTEIIDGTLSNALSADDEVPF